MYVTLSIGASRIRALAIKGREIVAWGSRDLVPGLVRDGLVMEPAALGEEIDALITSSGLSHEQTIVSLNGLSFTYRFLSLPRMKGSLREEALYRAAGKELPLPLDDIYLSWQPVGIKDGEENFFVIGVPRKAVDALAATMMAAGAEPYLMDLKQLALARAAGRREAIVVNLEPDGYDIMLVAEGVPVIMHTVNPRGEGATLEDNIERLIDELSRISGFYRSDNPDKNLSPATPLLLAGELAGDGVAGSLIQSELEYPVAPLRPPLETPDDFPAMEYAANIGLALKKVPVDPEVAGDHSHYQDININLWSGKYRRRRVGLTAGQKVLLAIFIVALAGLIPLFQAGKALEVENAALRNEVQAMERELRLAGLVAAESSRLEETILEITSETGILREGLDDLLEARGAFTEEIELIIEAMPHGLSLLSLEAGDGWITVRGRTEDPFRVVDYADNLEAAGAFTEVRITELDNASDGESGDDDQASRTMVSFEIVMHK